MTETVYISGKMRGMPEDESRRLFEEVERFLTGHGFRALNPWKFEHTSDRWGDRIIADLELLKTCDAIWMLENWRDSDGATVEYHFARGEGIKMMGPHS